MNQSHPFFYRTLKRDMMPLILCVVAHDRGNMIIALRTRHAVDAVARTLRAHGVACVSLHPNRSPRAKRVALAVYNGGHARVCVLTYREAKKTALQTGGCLVLAQFGTADAYCAMSHIAPRQTIGFVTAADTTHLADIESLTRVRWTRKRLPPMLVKTPCVARGASPMRCLRRRALSNARPHRADIAPMRFGRRRAYRPLLTA